MKMDSMVSLFGFAVYLLILGTLVYLVVLLIKALRKYLRSSDVRKEGRR